jgi:mono/diheme cytochrome c family protein
MTNMCKPRNILAGMAIASTLAYGQNGKVGRGRYLTEEVAQCQECHTQRLTTGQLDRSAWLKGAKLDFSPEKVASKSSITTPDITSGGALWNRWGESGMLQFLKTGRNPDGSIAAPPMPSYKLRSDDAEAIVAYLKSLR